MVAMPKNINSASKEEINAFLNSFDTVLCDCDGVLWLEKQVIENSENTINKLIENNKNLFYITNNNSLTREEYVEKCKILGFNATKDKIFCTSYLAAEYLASLGFDKKVYVIGNVGILKELDKAGIRHTDIGPDRVDSNLEAYVNSQLNIDPEVGAVLVGFDEHFSYPKILKAATYLKNPDCHFIACCSDETFPVSSRREVTFPGTGTLVRCLEAVSSRKAFILGKPNDYIKNAIFKKHQFDPSRTLMIGDRCNTDILFGNKSGFKTLLVLTGISSLSDVEKYSRSNEPSENALVPQYCINKLGDLLPYLSY